MAGTLGSVLVFVGKGKLGLTNSKAESFLLIGGYFSLMTGFWGLKSGPPGVWGFKPCRSKLFLLISSFNSLTFDFGEQQVVPFLGHLKSSVISALPKHVKER